ncbi:MAG: NAD(P)H-dependent oxidoreductase [Devosia sp.]
MKVLVLIAHPRPDILCHAFARTARDVATAAGWDVLFHDLYDEAFDPILKSTETRTHGIGDEDGLFPGDDPVLDTHRRDIAAAEALVVEHPNWWGKPPAIRQAL